MLIIRFLHLLSGCAGIGRALLGFWIATSLMLLQITIALFGLALYVDGLRLRFGLHLIAAIAAGAIVAVWSYRRKASRLNLLSAAGVGLSVAVLVLGITLWSSLFADDITELPGAISASLFFPGCAIVAGTVVFLIFWSVRVISSGLWWFARGPERRIELMRLMKGMVGAVAVDALAAAVQFAKGEHVSAFTVSEVFYAIIVPAVVAFGFFGHRMRRCSILFAIASLWAASSAAVATFPWPFTDNWHRVGCPGGPTGYHSVLGLAGVPWSWPRQDGLLEAVILGPAVLAELTYWHIADPIPAC